MSSDEVMQFMRYRAEPAETAPAAQSFDVPIGPELTPEQYEGLIGQMKGNAAQHGMRKPHG